MHISIRPRYLSDNITISVYDKISNKNETKLSLDSVRMLLDDTRAGATVQAN